MWLRPIHCSRRSHAKTLKTRHSSRLFWQSHVKSFPIFSANLADIGEGISEVEVLRWHVKEGDEVKWNQTVCDVQSDKASVEIQSPCDGKIVKLHHKVGNIAKVGKPLYDMDSDKIPPSVSVSKSHAKKEVAPDIVGSRHGSAEAADDTSGDLTQNIQTSRGIHRVLAAPGVRYLAKKNKIELSKIKGSGKDGRVTKGDVITFLQPQQTARTAPAAPTQTVTQADHVIKLRGFQRAMAQSMNHSLTIPHLGYCDEVEMDNLITLRENLKDISKSRGVKLSYMPFFIKAASLAMKKYPLINSKINNDLTEVTCLASHNIAIAVATSTGLAVPNIKNVQNLSIFEIAEELSRIIALAQENKIPQEVLSGSTFSLSNVGVIGGTYASPILVAPQVCIGALGKVQKLPRFNSKGKVIPVNILNVSWSADHRVIDGATIANFSNLWRQYIQHPQSFILDSR